MKLKVTETPVPAVPTRTHQMQVGILYFHIPTGSIILCTQERQPKTAIVPSAPAKGICLIMGNPTRSTWIGFPSWNFIEPTNYVPYKGALTLQNEFRPGEG